MAFARSRSMSQRRRSPLFPPTCSAVHGADDDGRRCSPTFARPSSETGSCMFPNFRAWARTSASRAIPHRHRRGAPEGRSGHGDRPAGKRQPLSSRGLAAEGETIVNRVYHPIVVSSGSRKADRLGRAHRAALRMTAAKVTLAAADGRISKHFRRLQDAWRSVRISCSCRNRGALPASSIASNVESAGKTRVAPACGPAPHRRRAVRQGHAPQRGNPDAVHRCSRSDSRPDPGMIPPARSSSLSRRRRVAARECECTAARTHRSLRRMASARPPRDEIES